MTFIDEKKITPFSKIVMDITNSTFSNGEEQLLTVWKKVVSKVKSFKDENEDNEKRMPIGERLAGNTRVVDLKNKVLLIETDHPGWIQYLNIYKKFILKGLKMELPSLEINSLAFRVADFSNEMTFNYDQMVKMYSKEMSNKMNLKQKKINELIPDSPKQKCELPPELLEKFESIKNSIKNN